MLGALVLMLEPMGWTDPTKDTILGYHYGPASISAIIVSSILGLLVNLSTFLVIGATSSLTYNVVGHVKTVIILTGGVVFFGDAMPLKKLAGIFVAMCGIVWYSQIKLQEARTASLPKLNLPESVKSGEILDSGSLRPKSPMMRRPTPADNS
jgi:solute carrier family 35 protein E3